MPVPDVQQCCVIERDENALRARRAQRGEHALDCQGGAESVDAGWLDLDEGPHVRPLREQPGEVCKRYDPLLVELSAKPAWLTGGEFADIAILRAGDVYIVTTGADKRIIVAQHRDEIGRELNIRLDKRSAGVQHGAKSDE